MSSRVLPFLVIGLVFTASSAALADPNKNESDKGGGNGGRDMPRQEWNDKKGSKGGERGDRYQGGGSSYFHQHGHTRLNIPPGHYPPPGECRVWFPDRPPGQQPPPGDCSRLPPGAWEIRHPQDLPGRVHVAVYDPARPGTLRAVGEFEIASGVFVRIVLER